MKAYLNPVADEWTERYAGYRIYHKHAILTQPIAAFLDYCSEEGLQPVVTVDEGTVFSDALTRAFARHNVVWAFRAHDGRVFNGHTGRQIFSFDDLFQPPTEEREIAPSYLEDDITFGQGVLSFDAFIRHQAVAETRIGHAAQAFADQLSGEAPTLDGWGMFEPATQKWNVDALTQTFQAQMPQSMQVHTRAGDTAAITMSVGRTKSGILEHVQGVVATGQAFDELERNVITHAGDALVRLAKDLSFNVAIVSLRDRESNLGQTTRRHAVDLPLAIFVGPRVVRDLGAQLEQLQQQFDIEIVGSPRVPAAVARFSGELPQWIQFAELAQSLDPERLNAVLGAEASQQSGGE